MFVHSIITGADAVVDALGTWPSFHDAEVLAFELERPALKARASEARLKVHVTLYEARNEGTVEYHMALVKSIVVAFRFSGIRELEIFEFNHQNVVDAIVFSEVTTATGKEIAVEVPSIFGFGGKWRCRTAEVIGVFPGPAAA
jgi:hypothetical protein